jgi:hypothetical protein
MICALGHVFGSGEGVGSRFHVLRAHTHFRRYRGRRVLFSCFARPESFLTVPRASSPVIMFCALGLVFGIIEGFGSRFDSLRPDSFSVVPRASGPVFTFCAPGPVVPRASDPVFIFCAPGLVFVGTESVRSRFHVLRARTHFRRYIGRRVPFS